MSSAYWSCRCGAKNEAGWRYCEGCGAASERAEARRSRAPGAVTPAVAEGSKLAREVLPKGEPQWHKPPEAMGGILRRIAEAEARAVAEAEAMRAARRRGGVAPEKTRDPGR